MIDSSFITTLPDTWAINAFYYVTSIAGMRLMREITGGLTCDSDDYNLSKI
jgi:arginine decarboxylase